jgi:hypothetical protein
MICRNCSQKLGHEFMDLGHCPPSNNYLTKLELNKKEQLFPLRTLVCNNCWFVQTEDFIAPDQLFKVDYGYLSSASKTWLGHCKKYATLITERLKLGPNTLVVEVASNDGYLLENFISLGIPCLGVEPTALAAGIARDKGQDVIEDFFSEELAVKIREERGPADLLVANNVFAHVPDIIDFSKGMKELLAKNGVITLEVPHLLSLMRENQFDTIYHEHFSYFSLFSIIKILGERGLRVFDVEKLNTHGGSLRVFACHEEDMARVTLPSVQEVIDQEKVFGLYSLDKYSSFSKAADARCASFLLLVENCKKVGKSIAGFGAAAKGNTLLNYSGIKEGDIEYICDNSIGKQGKYTPGTHIPIVSPNKLRESPPSVVIIFPWNLAQELFDELSDVRKQGVQIYTFTPELVELT